MNINELRVEIVKEFSPVWELNDRAHRVEHFEEVFNCGVAINEKLNLGFDPKLILFAAYFHDMFAWSRNNHHELSFHWMMSTDNKLILDNLNPRETMIVAWGCQQHRASFKGNFKSVFCELINSADRGFPGDVGAMLNRAVQFREKKFPEMTPGERVAGAVNHLKEKYGTGGYARYTEMYLEVFGDQLYQQRADIDTLHC
jgi:hypothetical protein